MTQVHAEQPRQGFALVLALIMMSFLLLLSLSLYQFATVETASASTALTQLRCKEEARMALLIALGSLQQLAGEDNRVTASASITGASDTPKYWTGVWNTETPDAPPIWLVSGLPGPSTPSNKSQAKLVGEGSVGPDSNMHVYAPQLNSSPANTTMQSKIAWWIADEGVKACIGNAPAIHGEANSAPDIDSIERTSTMLMLEHGLEEIFTNYNRFESEDARKLDDLANLTQLSLLKDLHPQHLDATVSPFHTLTPLSLGVLSSVKSGASGGLLRDLSLFPMLLGSHFDDYIALAEQQSEIFAPPFGSPSSQQLEAAITGIDQLGALSDGDLAMPVTPILSNFMIAFTIRSQSPVSSHPNLYLRMRFFCELWNPYTSSLRMRDIHGNELDLELEITGLPEVSVLKASGAGSSSPIDIQGLLADPSSDTRAVVIRLQYKHENRWLPGQTKNWTGINHDARHSPYTSTDMEGKQWAAISHTLGGATGIDTGVARIAGKIRHESSASTSLGIKIFTVNRSTSEKRLLSELSGLSYEAVSTHPEGYQNTHSGATFGYHFVLRGPHHSNHDLEYYRGRWLYDHDPRNPQVQVNDTWHLYNDAPQGTGSAYIPVKDGLTALTVPFPADINETDSTINTVVFRRLLDRSAGSEGHYNKLWQDTPLFELPYQQPLSLASLQHLYFHNERPFQVGNSWGSQGATNTSAWFDCYFFSGLSRSQDPTTFDPTRPLPNPALRVFKPSAMTKHLAQWQSDEGDVEAMANAPARHLLANNRFNINSTSVDAWAAVLSGLSLKDWHYPDYPEENTMLEQMGMLSLTRSRLFTRFPQTLAQTFDELNAPSHARNGSQIENIAPPQFYRRGARHFDQAEIRALAEVVVAGIKQRGRPFFSMEQFLSAQPNSQDSLLEHAIAAVLSINGRQFWDPRWETNGQRSPRAQHIPIDYFSPGFLTQADIMSAIGPSLAPRSDTFKIRAQSSLLNAAASAPITSTIEAIVQRTPEPLANTSNSNGPQNRRFRILSFKWLKPSEI